MSNFFEELKKYFQDTPREQVLENWAKSEKFDEVGPTVEEFLRNTKQHYKVHSQEPLDGGMYFTNDNLNPKFPSGFLINNFKYDAKSSIFN